MKTKNMFEIINRIDDDLIAEAGTLHQGAGRKSFRKVIAVAAAAVMLLGVTAFAATILLGGRSGHTYNIPSYVSVPDSQQLLKDTGIAPKVAETFSNGYRFDSGYISDNEDYDTQGNVVEAFKGLDFCYKNDQYRVELYVDGAMAGIQMQNAQNADTYKGSELLYYSYANKLVPGDYEMTPQDREDEKSGKYVFSYGSNSIEVSQVQGLAWEYNGLNYELLAMDNPITKDELIQMAKEVIDLQ